MKTHELKILAEFFEPVRNGEKTFELRKDDRAFRVGDVLILREWDPRTKEYTGRELRKHVTYLLGGIGLEPNYVCMAFGKAIAGNV
ncbi:MAG: ASCH/PUA domain-containing protein [Methanolobus sp.]|uniref:ASCH/PUA domain-containing protein n=1 Tax=Methanolobus sp. TaxID=1874737 RepID=UPI00272F20E0|nr:ASCH/PUA domain-containing protein [Methanolobus sp.]MDP2218500.1 ASCH/PUA domain-containing protein [Methanolobus sp.]